MTQKGTPVVISGAYGRLGQVAVQAIESLDAFHLTGAIGHKRGLGSDIGLLALGEPCGVLLTSELVKACESAQKGVYIDMTQGDQVEQRVQIAAQSNMACIIGASGMDTEQIKALKQIAEAEDITILWVPNFALGAVLMMEFSRQAAQYFDWAEIIERHHEKKKDSPSGTARKTLALIQEAHGQNFLQPENDHEFITGVRGGESAGVRVHSVRMPGYLAHQEVVFGGEGERLIITHDSSSRTSFLAGIRLSVQNIGLLSPGYYEGLKTVMRDQI